MYNQLIIAIELVLGGILLGGIYSLAALGFSINYSVAKIMNLSHGEFLILGGLFTYILVRIFNLNLLISIIMVSFASFIFGYLFYSLVTKGWSDTFDPLNHNKGVLKIVRSGIRSSRMFSIIGLGLVFAIPVMFFYFVYCSGYAFRLMQSLRICNFS